MAAQNLIAASAVLTATGGVGAAGNPLETTVAKLEVAQAAGST